MAKTRDNPVALSTVGIVFLGTPHRGTHAANWGQILAAAGNFIGKEMEDAILKDLKEDSVVLKDVLHEFTTWLFDMSISTKCFFEQHKTDFGLTWTGWSQVLVRNS